MFFFNKSVGFSCQWSSSYIWARCTDFLFVPWYGCSSCILDPLFVSFLRIFPIQYYVSHVQCCHGYAILRSVDKVCLSWRNYLSSTSLSVCRSLPPLMPFPRLPMWTSSAFDKIVSLHLSFSLLFLDWGMMQKHLAIKVLSYGVVQSSPDYSS